MEDKDYGEIIEVMYRNQIKYGFQKQKFINARIGGKKIHFPFHHLFFLPRQILETTFQHINNIESIDFSSHEPNLNKLIYDYYSNHCYEDIFKYREETIKIWHAFSKDNYWVFGKEISEAKQCIEMMEEKWENGFDEFDQEINFILKEFDQFIKKKEEDFMKQIPFEIYNEIIRQLPEKRKLEWIINIIPEGNKNITKSRRIEAIEELNIDKLNDKEMEQINKIISSECENEWIVKFNKRFQELNKKISDNQKFLDEQREREELVNAEKLKFQDLLKIGSNFFGNMEKEQTKKKNFEEQKKYIGEGSKLQTSTANINQFFKQSEEERKKKEEERYYRGKEEEIKQINQLPNGLNKEQQLLKSSEKGYIYAVKKLLKEGVNINAKDSR